MSEPQIPGLSDQTGLETRLPNFDLGRSKLRVDRIHYHRSTQGGPDGIMLEAYTAPGFDTLRAGRINLGGKFPKYAATDCKRLAAAVRGLSLDSPEAAALTAAQVSEMYSGANPAKGRYIEIEAFDSDKINPKNGKPYRNFKVLGPATGPDVASAPTSTNGAGVAAPPPPPPPPPPAPAAPSGPPAGWFALDPSHAMAATHWYNATGYLPK